MTRVVIVDENYCYENKVNLTVHKNSMFFPGDSFVAYDPDGGLLFRFDSYGPDSQPKDELVLMDATGKCLLTLFRKKLSLHQRWEGVLGERTGNGNPIFSVRRSSIIGRSSVVVDVYGDPEEEYLIEGSYPHRSCRKFNTDPDAESSSKEPIAEIRRKVDPDTNMMLGKDVFVLCVSPGFDGAFSMGLLLVLDQIFGDDAGDSNVEEDVELEPSIDGDVYYFIYNKVEMTEEIFTCTIYSIEEKARSHSIPSTPTDILFFSLPDKYMV